MILGYGFSGMYVSVSEVTLTLKNVHLVNRALPEYIKNASKKSPKFNVNVT